MKKHTDAFIKNPEMKVIIRYPAATNEYDREFGFYLDAWAFLFLLGVLFCFLAVTIFISRKTKREFYHRKLGQFEINNGYSYEYVFVFKVYQEDEITTLSENQILYSMKNIVDRMEHAQLHVKCFYSCQRDEIYVKVRATPDRLLEEAARINYKLELDPVKLQIAGSMGLTEKGVVRWKGFVITDLYKVSVLNPYDFIHAKFVKSERLRSIYKEHLIRCDSVSKMHILRPVDRIKLLSSIFEGNVNSSPPGCGLQLNTLIIKNIVLAHFPLHDFDELVDLERRWVKLFGSSVTAGKIYNKIPIFLFL